MSERRENSGLIDLDALLKQADSTATATPPVPADSLEAVTSDVASNPKLPEAPTPSPTPSPPKQTVDVPVPPRTATLPATPAAKRGSTRKTGAMIALGAAIVATLVTITFSRGHRTTAAPTVSAAAPAAAPVETTSVAPRSEPAIDPAALPAAPTADVPVVKAAAAVAQVPSAITAAKAAAAKTNVEPNVALGDVNAAAPPSDADLGGAMRSAVGARATTAAATEESAGGSAGQVRPSQGAVVGAINSVLPGARACLGPDDPVRSALVVFKSDGSVKAVEIRGSKEEDACVRSELAKARVAPFADDSFSTRVTVRP